MFTQNTNMCGQTHRRTLSSHSAPLHRPLPQWPPSSHLSALAKLIAAWLPASILTSGVRCAGTCLYGLPFRECSNSLTYPCWSICDTLPPPTPPPSTPVGAVALSNDDLINGDTPLAVEWDVHWQGASRGFQRLLVKIEVDTRYRAYEDTADRR